MSEPIDDKTFEEYLGRESQVSKRYRTLGADEVPADLDRRVLLQAQEAVTGKHAGSRKERAWSRWGAPFAMAASVVLVVSIVIESGTQHEVTMLRDVTAVMPQSAPAQDTAAPASEEKAEQELAAIEAKRPQPSVAAMKESPDTPTREVSQRQAHAKADADPGSDQPVAGNVRGFDTRRAAAAPAAPPGAMVSEPQIVPATPVVPPPAAAIEMSPPAPVSSVVTASAQERLVLKRQNAAAESDALAVEEIAVKANTFRTEGIAGQGAGPRGTIQTAASRERAKAAEALLKQTRESDPQRWLEYIRQLRQENKTTQADDEWKRFREAYPQHQVDEKDTARGKR